MDNQDTLHEQVRALQIERARRDHAAGKDRNAHGMNHGSAAIADYQAEWDRCEVARLEREQLEVA